MFTIENYDIQTQCIIILQNFKRTSYMKRDINLNITISGW
jgi:hypothetical protein